MKYNKNDFMDDIGYWYLMLALAMVLIVFFSPNK